MLMALSMGQLHLLAKDDQNVVQHDCFGHMMPFLLVMHSVMPLVLIEPFHSLGQDDKNGVLFDFFGHGT